MDAVDELHLVEVDEEADGNVQQLHVAEELRLVNWQDLLRSFGFHQDAVFNQHVEAERLLSSEPFVLDLHGFLADAVQFPKLQFLQQTPFINRLDEPRAFVAMDFDCSSDDEFSEARGFGELGVHGVLILNRREQTKRRWFGSNILWVSSRGFGGNEGTAL